MKTWSEAFAAQAAADLEAFEQLAKSAAAQSHRLHYLQMWLEKLCKAHVHRANIETLKSTHNVVAKILPRLILEHWRRIGLEQQPDISEIRSLCREVDLLHPQVDDANRRPDNVEYPWIGSHGNVEVPALWKFALAQKLYSNAGRLLLKAAGRLTRNPAIFIR